MFDRATLRIPLLAAAIIGGLATAAAAAHRPAGADTPRMDGIRLVVSATGNEARYRVRERLAGRELPNDAVGVTSDVTGAISLSADGAIHPATSLITITAATLKSDQDRRDNYVRRNTLETEQFPAITLAPTALRGLSGPLPTSGSRAFDLLGVLTVRGVSRPTVWRVAAEFHGSHVTGQATTSFTFTDFEIRQPRVPIVLSVADTIRLEYDFRFDVQQVAAGVR